MKFEVYSRTGCPYCTQIKQVLDGKNYEYKEYLLDRDFTKEEFYEKFSYGATFPQVLLDSNKLGGCQKTVQYLRENNLV